MRLSRRSLALACSFVSLVMDARADVRTVGGASPQFPTLQAAIDAAVDGDVVLVGPGTYAGATIAGKGIALVGEGAALVQLTDTLQVQATSAGQTVILSGLEVTLFPTGFGSALRIENCAGLVRAQDLLLQGASSPDSVHVAQSARVSFSHCTLRGSPAVFVGMVPVGPSVALAADASTLALYDTAVVGQAGQSAMFFGTGGFSLGPYPGAVGMRASGSSTCFVSGGEIRGGAGGAGRSAICFPAATPGGTGANGAPALEIDATSHLERLETVIVGGPGGVGGSAASACGMAGGIPGSAAADVAGTPANVVTINTSHRRLTAHSPARELTNVSFDFGGQPGDRAILITSLAARHELYPPFQGVILYGVGVRRIPLGLVPGSGTISYALPLPDLGAGVQEQERFFQALFIDASNQITLSDPFTLVTLDSAF